MRFKLTMISAIALSVISQSALAQSKQPIVAINQIEDPQNTGHSHELATMMVTAIASTNKFRVVERGQLNQLRQEQLLAKSGMVTSRNGARQGGFEGADYLVYGEITGVSFKRNGINIGASFLNNFARGVTSGDGRGEACQSGTVTLAVDVRITDGDTGQIRYAKSLNEQEKSDTVCGNAQAHINVANLLRTVANKVASGLVTSVYPIKVANTSAAGVLTLNYGEGAVQLGQLMTVFTKGEVIIDPDTQRPMGSSEEAIGIVKVTDVLNSMSKAEPVAGLTQPAPNGSIVRPSTDSDMARFKVGSKKNR